MEIMTEIMTDRASNQPTDGVAGKYISKKDPST